MGGLTVHPMTRNTLMAATAVLALALLVTAAVGSYRAFSYLSAALILAVFASAATERADRELDLGPYTSLVAGLGVLFVAGLTGIWLLWNPSVTEYTYVLGLPQSTLVYAVCSLEEAEGEAIASSPVGGELTPDPIRAEELPAGLQPTSAGWLRTDPGMLGDEGGLDGFFAHL